MRSLFLKIFVIFWIAQSLIFVISTAYILRKHFPRPDILFQFLDSSLNNEAKESADAFEQGSCAALARYGGVRHHSIQLQDASGQNLCPSMSEGNSDQQSLASLKYPDHVDGRQVGMQFVWSVPTTSSSGRSYIFIISRPHRPDNESWFHELRHFSFPQLPVAIAVGGVTTFVLVLLFTRPLVRLRQAARQMAEGNLSTRVDQSTPPSRFSKPSHFFKEDEFQGLAHDFNHMAERLESLVGAQQLLLRDVSHELRSPLSRLSVALELAREDAAPEMSAHLSRIEREAGKLNQLIGQLLTLSSMEALEKIDNFGSVSLNQLLEQMIPDAEYEARQRRCSVVFHAKQQCIIRGNRELLYRAIENVVRNAIRYTSDGSEVEITLNAMQDRTRQTAVLEVSDRGPGIPESEIKEIFRPFYRVDRARSQETGGFGVGLAITERAVKLHQGELHAFNRAGGGATIQLIFPFEK